MTQFPIEITYRDLTPTHALDGLVRRSASALAQSAARIVGCKIAVEPAPREEHPVGTFAVRLWVRTGASRVQTWSMTTLPSEGAKALSTAVDRVFERAREDLCAAAARRRSSST